MAVDDDEALGQQFMLDTAQNALNHFNHFLVGIRPASQEIACRLAGDFEVFVFGEKSGVFEGLADVGRFKIWIRYQNFFGVLTRGKQSENTGHREPQAADARFARAHGGIDRDSVEALHIPKRIVRPMALQQASPD